jgi:hypothetical protein
VGAEAKLLVLQNLNALIKPLKGTIFLVEFAVGKATTQLKRLPLLQEMA